MAEGVRELDPAPPEDHGVEWGAEVREGPPEAEPRAGKAAGELTPVLAPGTARPFTPVVARGWLAVEEPAAASTRSHTWRVPPRPVVCVVRLALRILPDAMPDH